MQILKFGFQTKKNRGNNQSFRHKGNLRLKMPSLSSYCHVTLDCVKNQTPVNGENYDDCKKVSTFLDVELPRFNFCKVNLMPSCE